MSTARKKRKKKRPVVRGVVARLAALEGRQGVTSESIRALAHQIAELDREGNNARRRLRELTRRVKACEAKLVLCVATLPRLEQQIGVVTARESYKLGDALEARITRVEREMQGVSPVHWRQHLEACKAAARELVLAIERGKEHVQAERENSGGPDGETAH